MDNVLAYRTYIESRYIKPIIAKTKKELQEAIKYKKAQYLEFLESRDLLDSNSFQKSEKLPKSRDSLESILAYLRISNNIAISIGLSPTMGALHNGHKSLILANVEQNHIAIVSIFVNPTQFGSNEDLDKYPRTLQSDIKMCSEIGVDIIFMPDVAQMYDSDEVTLNPPKSIGYILEGFHRPTHFSGVMQVVLKLFNLTHANKAYFGKKDAQQLLVIKKMLSNLCLDIEIIPIDIVRDADGLALSSRNVYLDPVARSKALAIPRAIFHIENLIKHGATDTQILKNEACVILQELDIDYADFYTHDLKFTKVAKECIFLLVARVKCESGNYVRLLDNLWIH